MRQQLIDLLTLCNQDFTPPLSHRASATDSQLTGTSADPENIAHYADELLTHNITAITKNGTLVAVMGWRDNGYISTIAVHPDKRGKGYGTALYGALPRLERVWLRTWSTNEAHLGLLRHLGFREFDRLPDDRGAGVDTVFWERVWDGEAGKRKRKPRHRGIEETNLN